MRAGALMENGHLFSYRPRSMKGYIAVRANRASPHLAYFKGLGEQARL